MAKIIKTREQAQLGGAETFSNLLLSFCFLLVRQAGFEPAAYGFVDQESWKSKI